MTTDRSLWLVDRSTATCACGQALDCCHSGHCPRCGVRLQDDAA